MAEKTDSGNKIENTKTEETEIKLKQLLDSKPIKTVTTALHKLYNNSINKLQNQLAERNQKQRENEDDITNSSSIFVTRSSIDFEKIKSQKNITESSIQAYPIIGACVIAIPYAIKEAGFPFGLVILLFTAIMVEYSEVLLLQCSNMADETCLQSIGKSLHGNIGLLITTILPYCYSLSVLTTYNIILTDVTVKIYRSLFHQANPNYAMIQRRTIQTILFLITVPIATTTNVKRIFKWSLVSLVSASFVTVFIAVRLFTMVGIEKSRNEKMVNTNLLQATAVMTFCLSCQHTCRLYYAVIQQKHDLNNTTKSENIASAYSLLCTIFLGISGYMTFRGSTQGNILENYCQDDSYATAARMFFAGFIICLYPLECQTLRQLVQQTIVVHRRFEHIFNAVITLIILIPPFVIALIYDCLEQIIETAGLLFAVPLVYILPSVLFLRLSPADGQLFVVEKLPCLISIIFGAIISVCGLTAKLFTSHKCYHSSFKYCNITTSNMLGPLITLNSLNGTMISDRDNSSNSGFH